MAKRAHGTGALWVEGGMWKCKWRSNGVQIKRTIGPARERRSTDGLTRSQAEQRFAELRATVVAEPRPKAPPRTPAAYTINDLWERYEPDARRRGLKQTTIEDYAGCVRNQLAPFFADTPIRAIDRRHVEKLVAHLEETKLKPKSIHNYVRVLGALFAYAERKEWIVGTPTKHVELPALRRDDGDVEPLRFLEVFEVVDLANAAQPGHYRVVDRALYLTAALTGLRQGELLGLRWQQVDFAASRVRVIEGHVRKRKTTPKSWRQRSVPLASTVAQALQELRDASPWTRDRDHVFADPFTGQPLPRTALMSRYRKSLKAARIDEGFRFHDLRHTFGTQMAKAGEPVTTISAWMGHADVKTTQIYMHYAPAADEAARIDAAFAVADPRGTTSGTNLPSAEVPARA